MKIADLDNETGRRGRLQPLTEAGYNRLLMHAQAQPFIMLSAARGDLSRDEIRKRSKLLVQTIRSQGLGAIQVEGHWNEVSGPVTEPSFFVPLTGKTLLQTGDDLLAFGQKLARDYQQEAILYGDTKWVYEVGVTLKVLGPITDITTKELGDMYSTIRNRDFKFPQPSPVTEYRVVGYRVPTGYVSALGMAADGLWPESKRL
jgi:hypothetical protein